MEQLKQNSEFQKPVDREAISKKLALTVLNQRPEIFHSVQGEGRHIGEVSTFIRTAGCNLHCGFCDSAFSWNYEGTSFEHDKDVKYGRTENIIKVEVGTIIDELAQYNGDRVIITGGEPMLQQDTILDLVSGLKMENPARQIEMETNGTLIPKNALVNLVDQFNVSPKLSNSGMEEQQRIKPESMQYFAELNKADFKFVVGSPEEIAEVDALVQAYNIPEKRVYLMPLGITKEDILKGTANLAEICKEKGYNLSTRLHTLLWGDVQGR